MADIRLNPPEIENTFPLTIGPLEGLFSNLPASEIGSNQAQDMSNVIVQPGGILKTREGRAKLNSTVISAYPITGIYTYYKAAGTKQLICACDTNLYKWVSPNWTSIKSGLTTSKDFEFETILDYLIMMNGTDADLKYDGTTVAAIGGSPPVGKYPVEHYSCLFMVEAADKSKVRFSDVGNFDSWPSTRYFYFTRDDGYDIVRILKFKGVLLVFKEGSLQALLGNDTDNFERYTYDPYKGAVASRSIVQVGDSVYYLNRYGVDRFNGIGVGETISFPIENLINGVNGDYIQNSVAWEDQGLYKLIVPYGASTVPNLGLIYDTRTNLWFRWVDYKLSCVTKYKDSTLVRTYGGDPETGFVRELDTGNTDDGSTFSWYWESKEFGEPDPRWRKLFRYSWVKAKDQSANISLNLRADQSGSGTTSTITLANTGAVLVQKLSHSEHGKFIRFKLSGNAPAEIHSLAHEGVLQAKR